MSFDDNNFDEPAEDQLPEESNNNRTFFIAIGILSGIILISVACLAGFLFFNSRNSNAEQVATANANATITALAIINPALTATARAILPTSTSTPLPTATPPVSIASATNTPDPANLLPAAPAGTSVAATATVGAALTQAAVAQLTVVATTTALPNTGFADDFGIPGLVVMALAFVIVILLARRLRTAPTLNK